MNPDVRLISDDIQGGAMISANFASHLNQQREQTLMLTPHQTTKLFWLLKDAGAMHLCTCGKHGK